LREFGRFPDTSAWEVGDLLLLSAVRQPLISRWIVAAQRRGGFDPLLARWHLAAISVGHDHVCEAVPTGIRYGPLHRYVGAHLIRVRRDASLTPVQRYELALRSVVRLKETYSILRIPGMAIDAAMGFWRSHHRPTRAPSVICSQIYADAYMATTLRVLGPRGDFATGRLVPADLSMTTALSDVATAWLAIR
jgi:hypothetical protein